MDEHPGGDRGDEDRNYKIASVANPAQKPPPESLESIRTRTLVILSFWAIVIFLGLPVWLWTTSIHRARLPLQDMSDWARSKVCKPTFPLQIAVQAPSMQEAEAAHLVRLTQHALDDLNEFSAHHLRLRLAQSPSPLTTDNASMPTHKDLTEDETVDGQSISAIQDESALVVRLQANVDAQTATATLESHSGVLICMYSPNQVPSVSSSSSALATFVATTLQELYTEEQAIIAYILSRSASNIPQAISMSSPGIQSAPSTSRDFRSQAMRLLHPALASRLTKSMTRSLKYAPTYHITISLFTPTAIPSSWDIEGAISEYFTPLLDSISVVSNFTVDTQVQLFATLSPSVQSPEHDAERGVWTLREEDLSGFINAAEWPLTPSTGAGPTLNFVLYVPDRMTSPLTVKGSQATSWLIPQWGGVFILNPQDLDDGVSTLSKEAIQPALLTFSHQLLSLLGAPETPPSLPLQLQTLTRIRVASLLLSASSSLGSLANLTVALPSIAIPETVLRAVDTTLQHLQYTCNAMRKGKFREALEHARTAEAEAERGFFEKSMVGQVYFPDEHKVAVYLPLLGPVGVPLVMSALKEVRRFWSAWKSRRPAK
ncbi:GPI transamidase component [Lecanora helva]